MIFLNLLKNISCFIEKSKIKRIVLFLVIFTGFLQLLTALFLGFDQNKVKHDIFYREFAKNWINYGVGYVDWEKNINPVNSVSPFHKGVYYNWRPVGYSIFLIPALLIDQNNYFIHFLYQLIFFSFLPGILFLLYLKISNKLKIKSPRFISLISTLIFIINPLFLITPMQYNDTGLITFEVVLFFLSVLFYIEKNNKSLYMIIISIIFLFFTRPVALPPLIIIFVIVIHYFNKTTNNQIVIKIVLFTVLVFTIWGIRNLYYFDHFMLTNSNSGYNLFIGNNEYTKDILESNYGDGSDLEWKIFPLYRAEFSKLQSENEFIKDKFLLNKARDYIWTHPETFFYNSLIKIVGVFSPIRFRSNDPEFAGQKQLIIALFWTPIIFSFFCALISHLRTKEKNKMRGVLFLSIFLWVIPFLFFFPTQRFRQPVDFIFILLLVDFCNLTLFKSTKRIPQLINNYISRNPQNKYTNLL